MVRARFLRNKITIQKQQTIRDDTGGYSITWVDIAKVWANVNESRGVEFIENNQVKAESTAKITIRYRNDINETMRILYRGREYLIIAPPVNVNQLDRELILYCDGRNND